PYTLSRRWPGGYQNGILNEAKNFEGGPAPLPERQQKTMLFANKINKLRPFSHLLSFWGFGDMHLCFLWPTLHRLFSILGRLVILGGVGIYFSTGILSMQAVQIECPKCGRITKILGKMDQCAHCKVYLSLDPRHAPKENPSQPPSAK